MIFSKRSIRVCRHDRNVSGCKGGNQHESYAGRKIHQDLYEAKLVNCFILRDSLFCSVVYRVFGIWCAFLWSYRIRCPFFHCVTLRGFQLSFHLSVSKNDFRPREDIFYCVWWYCCATPWNNNLSVRWLAYLCRKRCLLQGICSINFIKNEARLKRRFFQLCYTENNWRKALCDLGSLIFCCKKAEGMVKGVILK